VFVVLAVLAYPPVAPLMLFAVALVERRTRVRSLALLGMGFLVSYGLGVLLVHFLNWRAFGHFGIVLSDWRAPNPLEDLGDLAANTNRYWRQLRALGSLLGLAGLLGLVLSVLALISAATRRAALVLLAASLASLSLEAGMTLVTGAAAGIRASLWAWPALVLPGALVLSSGRRSSRAVAAVLMAALIGTGAVQLRSDIGEHQETRVQYDALVDQLGAVHQNHPDLPVILWLEPEIRSTATGNITAVTLRMMVSQELGIYPRWCRPAECARVGGTLVEPARGEVRVLDDRVVLRVPPPPTWL